MQKKTYATICAFIDSVKDTSAWRFELNPKYNIVPETAVYDIIQDLKKNTAEYLYGYFSHTIYWHQNEKYQFKTLVSFGMLYGLYEYLNDNIDVNAWGNTKCDDIKEFGKILEEYKENGLSSLLGHSLPPHPYDFPCGDPYVILQEDWVREFLEQKTGMNGLLRQFWCHDTASVTDVIPSERKDIDFVKEHKNVLINYAVPEILDLYLTWVSHLYSEYYKHSKHLYSGYYKHSKR